MSSAKDFYTAKQTGRRRMADPDDLTRFAFATIWRSHDLNCLGVADLIE
jgi:hypothetical protein